MDNLPKVKNEADLPDKVPFGSAISRKVSDKFREKCQRDRKMISTALEEAMEDYTDDGWNKFFQDVMGVLPHLKDVCLAWILRRRFSSPEELQQERERRIEELRSWAAKPRKMSVE